MKLPIAFTISVAVAGAFAFSVPLAAQTTTTRSTAVVDEPIVLPKLDAARVSARANERPASEAASVIVAPDRIVTQRVGGVTTIRVNPEVGIPYTLSNGQAGNQLRGRDHDQFRVPMWQLGKF